MTMMIDYDLRVAPPGWRVLRTREEESTGVWAELVPLAGWIIQAHEEHPERERDVVPAIHDTEFQQVVTVRIATFSSETWTLLGPDEELAPSMRALVDRCRQVAVAEQEKDAAALLARFVEPTS
jgi:hypothetical protein